MNIFIVNDTSISPHYGCQVVMKNIAKAIKKNFSENSLNGGGAGVNIVGSLYVGNYNRMDNNTRKLLKTCDLVLINGEGTLHHSDFNIYSFSLAQTAALIKLMYGKPIYLVNAAYFCNSQYLNDCLGYYDMVFTRDIVGLQELKEHGIFAELMPDMTFYSSYDDINCEHENYIGIIGSVDREIKNRLFSLKNNFNRILPIEYAEENFEQYIRSIKKSKGILSGRFHGVCFAIQTRTPFLAVESNIPKITALLYELNMPNRLIKPNDIQPNISVPEFTADELKRIDEYLLKAPKIIDYVFYKIFANWSLRYS